VDVAAATALPNDLAEWNGAARFVLGVLRTTKDLDDLSAMDYARIQERVTALACRQGLGALIARLGENVPIALSTPATKINWGKRATTVETPAGVVSTRAVIVTASTNVLQQAGGMTFAPELPKRQLDALARLSLGSYERIGLELPGNPLGLGRDERMLEQSVSRETGLLLANIGGSSLCTVDIGGGFARDLGAQGEAAMIAFAVEWLVKLFGSDIKTKVGRSAATRWDAMPYIRGATSAAVPGGQPSRRMLMEPLQNLYFAGEACHETLWGTVGGAWESGERAAAAALKGLAPAAPPAKSKRPAKRRH
jgi:monoamine oxidase